MKSKRLNLKELNINNPPMKRIIKFHLSLSNWNFVSTKDIKIETIKNMPLMGSAVDRKNTPKLKDNCPILLVLIGIFSEWFVSKILKCWDTIKVYLLK